MVASHQACSLGDLATRGAASRIVMIFLLSASIVAAQTLPAFAGGPQKPDPAMVAAQVKKFGVGKSVKVKLANGVKLSGHVEAIGADSFTVKIAKTSVERPIPYDQVTEVKDPSPLTWMLIGAALVIVIILIAKH